MIIANYQVQNTLRAYGQQLAERTRLSKIKTQKNSAPKDQVSVSAEGKRKLTAERITKQIIKQFFDGSELTETHREILNRVNRGYRQPIQIEKKEGQEPAIRTFDRNSPDEARALSPDETEKLKKKLFEITHALVYNNLTS